MKRLAVALAGCVVLLMSACSKHTEADSAPAQADDGNRASASRSSAETRPRATAQAAAAPAVAASSEAVVPTPAEDSPSLLPPAWHSGRQCSYRGVVTPLDTCDYDPAGVWAPVRGGTVAVDARHCVGGMARQSIAFTTNGVGDCGMVRSLPSRLDLSRRRIINVFLWINPGARGGADDWKHISSVYLGFLDDAGRYRRWRLVNGKDCTYGHPGYNWFRVFSELSREQESGFDPENVTRMQIWVTYTKQEARANTLALMGVSLETNPLSRGVVLFAMDGLNEYTKEWLMHLNKLGFPGAIYTCEPHLPAHNSHTSMTLDDMRAAIRLGHVIGNYPQLSHGTYWEDWDNQTKLSYFRRNAWFLLQNGIGNGASLLSTPGGACTEDDDANLGRYWDYVATMFNPAGELQVAPIHPSGRVATMCIMQNRRPYQNDAMLTAKQTIQAVADLQGVATVFSHCHTAEALEEFKGQADMVKLQVDAGKIVVRTPLDLLSGHVPLAD